MLSMLPLLAELGELSALFTRLPAAESISGSPAVHVQQGSARYKKWHNLHHPRFFQHG